MLGDNVAKALATIGVTDGTLTAWLGIHCGCGERREKLNSLDKWARRVLAGKTEAAVAHLRSIMGVSKGAATPATHDCTDGR